MCIKAANEIQSHKCEELYLVKARGFTMWKHTKKWRRECTLRALKVEERQIKW